MRSCLGGGRTEGSSLGKLCRWGALADGGLTPVFTQNHEGRGEPRLRPGLALLALVLALTAGCASKGPEHAAPAAPVTVTGVTVALVPQEQLPELQEAVGTVRAKNLAQVAARIPGTVSAVQVREGDRVARGRLLVAIEAAESGAAAAGAAAGVEEAQRALDEARSRKRLADATFERYRRLFQEQAVTRQEFDERQMQQDVATQGVARAEARLAQAREGARGAGTVAGYARVAAPISGVVVAKSVEPGQTVFPGTPLLNIEGEGGYRLEVAAPEALLGKVRAGDQVRVAVEGAAQNGRVVEVVPVVDPGSRTFTVKIDLTGSGLRSGSYGKAFFTRGSRPGVALPAGAVVERGALTSVWVIAPEGTARLRLVKLGRNLGDRVEVISGLTAGERVAVAGLERLVDGARVQAK